jgi:hypothetical protein
MPLATKLDSLEGLDESLHDNYEKQEDGTYLLAALKGFIAEADVENVDGLKSALDKERASVRDAAKKFKNLQEKFAGVDLEKYESLLAAAADHEEAEATKKGEWDKLKVQMVDKHNEDLAKKDSQIGRLKKELERHLVDAAVTGAISTAEGNVQVLKPHVKALVTLVEQDSGEFAPQVVDASGSPRVNGSGDPLSITDLVSEMRGQEVFAGCFKGSGQSGSDSLPLGGGEGSGDAGGGGIPTIPKEGLVRSSMTTREKVDFVRAHGDEAFQSLPQ